MLAPAVLAAASAATYVDHGHVTTGVVVAVVGVLGLVFGLIRKLVVLAVVAVVVVIVGVVVFGTALNGTHCAPDSRQRVCLTVNR